MDILCKGFRGCERAEIHIAGTALLAGKNGMGKSSICQAVAAALTGSTIPFFIAAKPDKPVLTKTEAKGLVRGGVDRATVVVLGADDGHKVQVDWPSHEVKTEGKPPQASRVAAGLLNPLEFGDVERQKFMSGLLQADPTEKDLAEALKDAGFDIRVPETEEGQPPELALPQQLWNRVQTQGWDPAHIAAKAFGAQLKGRWEGATGTDFGVKKAAGWKPEGWNDSLDRQDVAALIDELATARQKVENALGALAVDSAEIVRLQNAVSEADALQARLSKAEHTAKEAKEKFDEADELVRKTAVPEAHACAHCGGLLQIEEHAPRSLPGVLMLKAFEMTADERDALRSKHEDAVRAQVAAKKKYAEAAGAETNLRMELAAVANSRAELEKAKAKRGSQEAVDLARDFAATCEAHLKRLEAKTKADELFAQIVDQLKLVEILAPDGLRRSKLSKALEAFNNHILAPLCVSAEYPAIAINEDLELVYGARRYFLLSASEQYRCRAVFQTAVAMRDKSALVILDGADILDDDGRNGLFNMVAHDDLPMFLIAMTVNSAKRVPDLLEAGLGESYWIENGRAEPLAQPKAA